MQSSAHSIAQSSSRAGTHCKARRSHRAIVIKGGSCVELRRLPTRTLFGRRDRPSRHQLCAAGPSTRSLPCSHDRWLNTVQLGSRRSSAPTVLLLSSASLISSPRSGASAATSLIALVATRGPPFTSIAKGPCLRRSLIDRVRRAHIIDFGIVNLSAPNAHDVAEDDTRRFRTRRFRCEQFLLRKNRAG